MAWVKYNPNPVRSDPVGDCAVRAISKALDVSWEQAHTLLSYNSYMMGDIQNSNAVIGAILRQHGFKRFLIPDTCPVCYSVAEFSADNPNGRFVLGTGNHVVTVIDGNYYDSWNSGSEIPVYAWYKFEDNENADESNATEETRDT